MENSGSPIMPGMSFNLTNEELLEFKKKSQGGDAEASQKLWLFYNFTLLDHDEAEEWLEKAAEQGLPVAQYSLAFDLSRRGSPRYDLEKAKYWATKAANNGEKLALGLLQQIEKLEEPGNSK
jgi:TPR repeat protein